MDIDIYTCIYVKVHWASSKVFNVYRATNKLSTQTIYIYICMYVCIYTCIYMVCADTMFVALYIRDARTHVNIRTYIHLHRDLYG